MSRTINTAAELEALPVGSGLIDKYGDLGLIDNIIGIEGQRVVQYAETGPMALEYVAKHYLPATVVHDPSAPVVPSATREEVRDEIAGHPIGSGYYATSVGVDEAAEVADALLARFTITPRTDR